MNRFNKMVFVLPILLGIVLISGCIGQGTEPVTGSNGLVIKGIYTNPESYLIEPGDKLTIYYELENNGGATAEKVLSTIYGITWISEQERLSRLCFPYGKSCKAEEGETLFPPDPITGNLGGTAEVHFDVDVPTDILKGGMKMDFPLRIRSSYDYHSSFAATLVGYSKKRFNRDIQLGKQTPIVSEASIPLQSTIAKTPVSIGISGPDRVIVHDGSETKFTYHITFTNVGDGYPMTNNDEGKLTANIRIDGPGVYFSDCVGVSEKTNKADNVPIILRGRSVTKSCTIGITNSASDANSWYNREYSPINFYIDLSYRYFVEKDFKITVTAPVKYG